MVTDTGRTEPFPPAETEYLGGCRSTAVCNSCGAVVSDSICLCIPAFTCPRCGVKNEPSFFGSIEKFDQDISMIYEGLGIIDPNKAKP